MLLPLPPPPFRCHAIRRRHGYAAAAPLRYAQMLPRGARALAAACAEVRGFAVLRYAHARRSGAERSRRMAHMRRRRRGGAPRASAMFLSALLPLSLLSSTPPRRHATPSHADFPIFVAAISAMPISLSSATLPPPPDAAAYFDAASAGCRQTLSADAAAAAAAMPRRLPLYARRRR